MTRDLSRIVAAGALLLGTICPAGAATYRWIDDDGVVHLTNRQSRVESPGQREVPAQPGSGADSQRKASDASRSKESAELRRMESVTIEVMRLSGLTVQLDLLATGILGEFDRMRSSGSPPAAGAGPLVAQTFSADSLRSNMQEALARSLDPERTRALLAWLRTPLSQRIVSLESALAMPDGQTGLTDFVNLLPSTPPAPVRLTLVHRLERAGDVTQGSAVVLAAAGAALRKTVKPFVPPAALAQPDRDGQRTTPSIDENTRFRTMVSLLFIYRELSDAELGRYVSFLESPTGRWFTRISQAALLASLDPLAPPSRTHGTTADGKRPKSSEAAFTAADPRD